MDDAKLEVRDHLKKWISEASNDGDFFSGKDFSMVDVALAPWAVRLWPFEHFKGITDLIPAEGKGGEDEKIWQRWRRWTKAIEERNSVKNTLSDREHYLPIYQRYVSLTAAALLLPGLDKRANVFQICGRSSTE